MGEVEAPAPRFRFKKAGIRLGLSAFVLTIVLWVLDPAVVFDAVRSISPGVWFLGLTGFCAFHVVGAIKWRLFMGLAGAPASFGTVIRAYAAGLFANLCLPSLIGGDVLRAGILMRGEVRKEAVVLGSLVDRFSDVGALAFLVLAGAASAPAAVSSMEDSTKTAMTLAVLAPVAGLLTLVVLAVAARRVKLRALPRRGARIVIGFLRAWSALRSRPGTAIRGFALCVFVQAGFVIVNWQLGRDMGFDLDVRLWFLLWPMAKIAAMLPVSLGGIGVREAAFAALVAPFGASRLAAAQSLVWESILIVGGLLAGAWWGSSSRRGRP